MEQDIIQVIHLFKAEKMLQQGQMARTGNGQELRHALYEAKKDRHWKSQSAHLIHH